MLRALYVDFNSYFASVEQQEVPKLRGKPIGVLPVMADTTCCIAASYEAKRHGVKTGTSVWDAIQLCPDIEFVHARPFLYVEYHHRLVELVESCTHVEKTLSIDEMVCRLTGSQQKRENALALAQHIKLAIAAKVGEHIRSSIGIAPNTFLAKIASNMQKPDGCVVIEQQELPERLLPLKLRDLHGVGRGMEARLNSRGIHSIKQLYALNRHQLQTAWGSIEGSHLYDKLRGSEQFEVKNPRSSLGHSHVLPPLSRTPEAALAVLHRLLQKACMRLRSYKLHAGAMQVKVKFLEKESWTAKGTCSPADDTRQLTQALKQLWRGYPDHHAAPYAVGISLSKLAAPNEHAWDLFESVPQQAERKLSETLDKLNMRYGKHTVYFGGAHYALSNAPMRIAFNHIPDMNVENDGTPKRAG